MQPILQFEQFNLDEKVLRAIKQQKLQTPTEIQQQAIPIIDNGHDVMATAETGSGKTLAFVIPALTRIMQQPDNQSGRGPRVLILSPTRELANQIHETIKKMAQHIHCKSGNITGGVPYFNQEKLLRNKCDLLVATPGRLIDHMNQGRVDFSRIELLVLDEADRMLDMGFRKDVELIMSVMPEKRQILLFSATLEGEIQKIATQYLKDPIRIELAKKKQHASIHQEVLLVNDLKHKNALLQHILEKQNVWQAIVFTRTKRGAEKLADDLSYQEIDCAALHGDMKQSKRSRIIERMHRGDIRILIATDVAARGIDVKKLSHVINYDLPSNAEDYVHRIGRTGRCGETGIAISFVSSREWSTISHIEKHTGQRLKRSTIEGLEPEIKNNEKSKKRGNEFQRREKEPHFGKRFKDASRKPNEQSWKRKKETGTNSKEQFWRKNKETRANNNDQENQETKKPFWKRNKEGMAKPNEQFWKRKKEAGTNSKEQFWRKNKETRANNNDQEDQKTKKHFWKGNKETRTNNIEQDNQRKKSSDKNKMHSFKEKPKFQERRIEKSNKPKVRNFSKKMGRHEVI